LGNSYFETREDFEDKLNERLQLAPLKTVLIDSVICYLAHEIRDHGYETTYYREIDVHKLRLFSCGLNAERKESDQQLIKSVYAPTDYMELALKRL
jgi:hypothetical protein